MSRRLTLPAALLAVLAFTLVFLAGSAQPYTGPNPYAPYRNPALDTQFWEVVRTFNDPTQIGREGNLIRTGRNNMRVAARLMPELSRVGTLSLGVTAFELGWVIGRGVDTRFLHLSGGLGTTVATPAPITSQRWTWKPLISSSYQSVGAPPSGWVWTYTTSQGTFDSAEQPCGATPSTWCSYSNSPQDRDASYLAGWQRMTDPAYSGDLPGTTYAVVPPGAPPGRVSYQRILSAEELQTRVMVERSEAYTGQPFDEYTVHTIPSDVGTAGDRGAARAELERQSAVADAAQKHVNHVIVPLNPLYPDPLTVEVEFPAPTHAETYVDYVARLRALGWLGTATVVQLDDAGADPAFAASGVPCTSARPYTAVTADAAVTFYRNPTPLGSGSGDDSRTWDCRGSVTPPDNGGCEYDATSLPYPEWSVGRTYALAAYDQACRDAWDDFEIVRGGVYAQPSRREGSTGKIKDPAVISSLTSSGGSIDDWEKREWGPFVVNALTYVVHAYRNKVTGEVKTDKSVGYKLKFKTEIAPYYPAPG